MSAAAIDVRDVSMWYGAFQALSEVSLSVKQGGITALVGPSGCGKSTLLKCFNRMHERAGNTRITGRIEILGHDVLAASVSVHELRRHVGLVFQRPNPLPLSVLENVTLAASLFERWSREELHARAKDALQRVELWDALKDRLGANALSLSLEQQQRLCIARLLPLKPSVLLMDEPCSALDSRSTQAIEELLRSLRGEYTSLVVTHSMAQARRLADDCAFMLMGRVVEAGPTEQLFTSATDPRTRDYLAGRFG